ncbi:MAG: cryptochrome/photolyase family protein [Methylophilaceae bacterium]
MNLRLVLGDQLNRLISSLEDVNHTNDVIMLCEVLEEATYVKHHQKKLVFIFSAMRHFAEALRGDGFQVHYVTLDQAGNTASFSGELERAVEQYQPEKIIVTEASEYRVLECMKNWQKALGIAVEIRPDKRFLCSHKGFNDWAEGRKQLRMEYFYRELRKSYQILMDGDSPVGGDWNYDADNQKPLPENINVSQTYQQAPDAITQTIIDMVKERFSDHFGDTDRFHYAVTRKQALDALKQFIDKRLPLFGDYQDAMLQNESWLFHSHISMYLNCGLLLPMECVKLAEEVYYKQEAPINAVEGFIRQIVGWREFVRGVYWLNMPEYAKKNSLDAQRRLPQFYWSGQTKMNCVAQCVKETKQHAYAHHIQRLMVLGNFALLAGIHPDDVNEWYLLVYADAYQWVELPNVTGMALFADGGLLASKPYAASGAYINKMSNYCKNCHYDVKAKHGESACPFNYLYWHFLIQYQEKFAKNPRMAMIYSTLNKMDKTKQEQILHDSEQFLTKMSANEEV